MRRRAAPLFGWLFDARLGPSDRLRARWLFLRALAAIYFSAFYSLVFQIHGLIGPQGILPAQSYLQTVAQSLGHWERLWYVPSVLWVSSGSGMLSALCWIGMVASILLFVNLWPRGMLAICFVLFLSFVSAAQDFSSYQSDGMLLEAGFISLFFAPRGVRPGLGANHPPIRASLFLLQWEWFRIYFESGVVKLLSGDPQWRNFTAMDDYYQNGPLPTWIGWYAQHLPHWFHAGTVYATLAMELGIVWMLFLPRRWRIVCFFIVTPWQIGVILTANYAFLNYLVLCMGILLLDDGFLSYFLRGNFKSRVQLPADSGMLADAAARRWPEAVRRSWKVPGLAVSAIMLTWIAYATTAEMMLLRVPLPRLPIIALEPFRIANQYGLFAVMTRGRYEIEFQGSSDGETWIAYPFRYKPQALNEAPRIYAPYQPRFDWNLWFASLGSWRQYPLVPSTELKLLSNDKEVLKLFAGNPFSQQPPQQIRALLWQYWFTSMAEKRSTGMWWRRELLGLYAPTIERTADGQIRVVEWPKSESPHE
jgi:hypothetical protein